MTEAILEKLKEVERCESVRILHAVESGSRAWGFASPDSDYDVRFIYLRRPEEYLRLDHVKDTIEWQLDEVMDINGWDVKKALQLAQKVNPTLYEWNNSPIVYRTSRIWKKAKDKIDDCFLSGPALHHYFNMAYNNYENHRGKKQILLKRYFYAIRPILAAKWILQNEAPPPVLFTDLLEAEKKNIPYKAIVDLLERKKYTLEFGKEDRMPELDTFIEKELEALEKILNNLNRPPVREWGELNKLFLWVMSAYNWKD